MENCIFCQIAKGQVPSDRVYENDHIVAFKDLNPLTPIHLLLVPKKHYRDFLDLAQAPDREAVLKDLVKAVREICDQLQLDSFNLINNCGEAAGQSVMHVHFHLLSGVDITKRLAQE